MVGGLKFWPPAGGAVVVTVVGVKGDTTTVLRGEWVGNRPLQRYWYVGCVHMGYR